MISKVNVNGVASYIDHSQSFDFNKVNLFFGYNGSGKTTLSRIFSCLERGKIIDEIEITQEGSFVVYDESGSMSSDDIDIDSRVRVFNRDYTDRNINYDNLTGVFIAGEESLEKQKKIEALGEDIVLEKGKQKHTTQSLSEQEKYKDQLIRANKNMFSAAAKFIKDGLPGYDNSYSVTKILQFIGSDKHKQLSKEKIDLDSEIRKFNSPIKERISSVKCPVVITEEYVSNLNDLLIEVPTSAPTEKEITKEVLRRIEVGFDLHEGKDVCEFCSSPIEEDRINFLKRLFSEDYKKIQQNIVDEIEYLKGMILEDFNPHYDRSRGLAESGFGCVEDIQNKITGYNEYVKSVIGVLNNKISNLFDGNLTVEYVDCEIIKNYEVLNDLIDDHNDQVSGFHMLRNDAADSVITYQANDVLNSDEYSNNLVTIEKLDNSIERIKKRKQEIDNNILTYESEVSKLSAEVHELGVAAEKFNAYLWELLPDANLRIKPVEDSNIFKLYRGDSLVNKLSEGERNILSFIYFVLSFSDGGHKDDILRDTIDNKIVFIDDPVSSLDDSNLYLIAAFIKKHFICAKQLFVTTHNFTFWRALRDREFIKQETVSCLLIEKRSSESSISIMPMGHPLVKHQSDYTFVYSRLRGFVSEPNIDDNVGILNYLRKFLEHFTSFMFPGGRGIKTLLDNILDDEVLSIDVYNFITYRLSNDGSHMQTRTDFIAKNPLDIAQSIGVVLDALRVKYPEHISSLDASCA